MDKEEGAINQNSGWARSPVWPILFAVALAAVIVSSLTGKPLFKLGAEGPANRSKEYRDDDLGFSLSYPATWAKLSPEELSKFQGEFAFAVRRSKPDALFGIKAQKLKDESVDLKQVAKALDRALPKDFEDFKKIDQEIFEINGRQALTYDYIFTAQPPLEVREKLMVVAAPGMVFHLTAWAAAKNFSRVEPDFDKITGSFAVR